MKPLVLNLHWGGQIVFNTSIGVSYDPLVPKCSTLIREKLSYSELLDLVYSRVGITKEEFKLNVLYRYPDKVRSKIVFCALRLHDDDSVEMFFEVVGQLGSFIAELYIETEPVSNMEQNHQNERQNCSFPKSNVGTSSNLPNSTCRPIDSSTEIGRSSLTSSVQEAQRHELTSVSPERVVNVNSVTLFEDKILAGNETDKLDRDGEDYGFEKDEGGEGEEMHFSTFDFELNKEDGPSNSNMQVVKSESSRLLSSMDDYGDSDDSLPDPTDDKDPRNWGGKRIPVSVWSEDKCQIQLGMRFKDKEQLKRAISLWSGRQKRDYKVSESKGDAWVAKCKSEVEAVKGGNRGPRRMPCLWRVRAVRKGTHKMWQITKWVTEHSCASVKRPSSKRNWTSPMIANCIKHLVEENPCYTVKDVQKYAEEEFGVDISYKKGWIALQKALQLINGT